MTKIFYDCEFLEDGRTIDLISIGMVREDGAEYYAVNRDMPAKQIARHDWLMHHVVPSLPRLYGDARMMARRSNLLGLDFDDPAVKPHKQIADEVKRFVLGVDSPELWAWYGAYDHVVLCQMYGRMIDLPTGFPMFTCDLKQEAARLGDPAMPQQAEGEHNALADARHNKVMSEHLAKIAAGSSR